MPKQTEKQQITAQAVMSPSKSIISGNEEFDIEAAKARVLAREASKERNNAKSESYSITSEKYALFCTEIESRKKRGWNTKVWEDDAALAQAVEDYKAFVLQLRLYPTIEGLSLWLDITRETYYAMLNINDNRSYILKKYKNFLDDFSAQNIASTEGNPGGNIYLDKSRLGYSDQPAEQTINLNIGTQQAVSPSDLLQLAQNTPIEAEYTEVDDG